MLNSAIKAAKGICDTLQDTRPNGAKIILEIFTQNERSGCGCTDHCKG